MNLEITPLLLGKVYLINFFLLTARYFLFSGIAFYLFWVLKKDKFSQYRIQKKFPEKEKIYSEIKYSLSTFLIFSMVGVGIFYAKKKGYTFIYNDINEYGYFYFFISILVSILVHDAYFYWMHRAMHTKLFFKTVHQVHHISTNPSPFAAFSFHPLEAIFEAGILPLLVFLIPLHPLAILFFILFMTLLNVLGHLGYELYPTSFVSNSFSNWNNTSFHHNMHHQKFNCNYGLYFNWWDKIFKTNHELYQSEFERLTSERNNAINKERFAQYSNFQ